ncbi:MAG: bifunctional adenosylcobinamide kinase/adenosylcobinamide-phosphate guanylyltransferase [Oscillospiraceae bacterium]|nr:bifunctional adenosylcobinamide kinase/adenosylcobinamide-phosphate guanylyltransferase [Oscillospiraceae bacterium]
MKLIIGGYAQGRLSYALKKYHLTERDVLDLENVEKFEDFENPDFWKEKKIIYHAENLITSCLRNHQNILQEIQKKLPDFQNKIIITQEVGCGLVPIDPDERRWREAVGHMNQLLAEYSESVERVCCGLGMFLKQMN